MIVFRKIFEILNFFMNEEQEMTNVFLIFELIWLLLINVLDNFTESRLMEEF